MAELKPTGSVYQRVPKTPAIALLATVGDMPVPWVTEWQVDGVDPKHPNFGALGGLAIDCTCRPGVGTPLLGKQCVRRQREAMLSRRCSVCGVTIDGLAVFAGVSAYTDSGGRLLAAISVEAPTCVDCLAYSALGCPTLAANAARCRLALCDGAYPVYDRWVISGDDETTVVEYGHRRMEVLPGVWDGALDFHITGLDHSVAESMLLSDWMRYRAPQPYRNLWNGLAVL
jgi:hypothetical protein